MNIIDDINHKVQALVSLGLADEPTVRHTLAVALTNNPNRNPHTILNQQYALMVAEFHTKSC